MPLPFPTECNDVKHLACSLQLLGAYLLPLVPPCTGF